MVAQKIHTLHTGYILVPFSWAKFIDDDNHPNTTKVFF